MIPELQLAIAAILWVLCALSAFGMVLAAFLLPAFLRDRKKHGEEMECQQREFDEKWNRRASSLVNTANTASLGLRNLPRAMDRGKNRNGG